MGIVEHLFEKPWQTQGLASSSAEAVSATFSISSAKLGLRIFFIVVSILFMLLTIAYAERIVSEEWRPAPQPTILWTSTIFLILASTGFQWATYQLRNQSIKSVKTGIMLGGLCSIGFIGSQLAAWQQLSSIAILNISNPAIAFFYLITALHALHLMGGLAVWANISFKTWSGEKCESLQSGMELCTSYWHFLLIVWVILFGLLFSGNDNLAALLAICGLR